MVVIRFCSDVAEHFELEAATALDIFITFPNKSKRNDSGNHYSLSESKLGNGKYRNLTVLSVTKVLSPNYYALQSTKIN